MGNLANSEYPDEMQHKAAFHQGLHCLLRLKEPSETDIHYNLQNSTPDPLKYTMGSPILCCINPSEYKGLIVFSIDKI